MTFEITGVKGTYRIWSLALIGLASLLLGACGAAAPQPSASDAADGFGQPVPVDGGGQYTDILPQKLKTMLEGKDFFFVNVHVPYEGEIPDTDAFIPFDQVHDSIDEFPQDTGAKIVVYCRSGSMSTKAANDLARLGYTNVYNLDGGFRAWSAAGYDFIPPD